MIVLNEKVLNMPLKEARKVFERKYFLNALKKHRDISLRAKHCGITEPYMYIKLRNLGMLVYEEVGE